MLPPPEILKNIFSFDSVFFYSVTNNSLTCIQKIKQMVSSSCIDHWWDGQNMQYCSGIKLFIKDNKWYCLERYFIRIGQRKHMVKSIIGIGLLDNCKKITHALNCYTYFVERNFYVRLLPFEYNFFNT